MDKRIPSLESNLWYPNQLQDLKIVRFWVKPKQLPHQMAFNDLPLSPQPWMALPAIIKTNYCSQPCPINTWQALSQLRVLLQQEEAMWIWTNWHRNHWVNRITKSGSNSRRLYSPHRCSITKYPFKMLTAPKCQVSCLLRHLSDH